MTQFAGRPYAVFDIDGTLYRWQFFHELVQELTLLNIFPEDVYQTVNAQLHLWRGGNLNFDLYEQSIVKTLEKYLPEIPVDMYLATCEKVIEQSKHKTYHYTRNLIQQLKKDNYVIVAISGSQQELLDLFGPHYGFDIVIGAIYERNGNQFTGKMLRKTVGQKAEILHGLIEEHGLTGDGSLAIGDGDGDAAILELVERPIAFNPAEGLFKRAKQEGWSIVIERKNIAYRLQKEHDALILAETIVY